MRETKKAKVVMLLSILLVAYGCPAAIPLAAPISESLDHPIYLPLVLKDWRLYEFMYEQGSMQVAPNCGVDPIRPLVLIAGEALDHDGSPMEGVTARLQFGFVDMGMYTVSEPDGHWGFGTVPPQIPATYYVRLVNSWSDPTPRSDVVTINSTDCEYGWTVHQHKI